MSHCLKSRKAFMMEVIVAMALATFLASTLLISYYKVVSTQKKVLKQVEDLFLTDNLFFTALKEFVRKEEFAQKRVLKEGLETAYGKIDGKWSVAGYDPLKKRVYYHATIEFFEGEHKLRSYNLILKAP
ncbi:MAG: type II secretion system protein [Chlamydiota bacterium]